MDSNMKIFSSYLLKQLIIFIIIVQNVSSEDMIKSKMVENGASTSKNNLISTWIDSSTDPRLRQIRSTNDTSKLDNLTLCVSKIKSGDTREAVEYFKKLKPGSIVDVITKSYHCENINEELPRFRNIIDFIIELRPSKKNNILAVETIYNLLKSTNDLYSFKGVLFWYLIRNCPKDKDLSIRYIYLMMDNVYLKNIKQRWVNALLSSVHDQKLYDFSIEYYEYFAPLSYGLFLKEIKSKSNLTNKLDNILRFIITNVHTVESMIRAYSALYSELDKNDLLSNNNIRQKLGQHIKEYLLGQLDHVQKSYVDKIGEVCNALDSCK